MSKFIFNSADDKIHASDKNNDTRASSISLNDNCHCEKSISKLSHRSQSFHGGQSAEQKEKSKMAASLNCRYSEGNIKVQPRYVLFNFVGIVFVTLQP